MALPVSVTLIVGGGFHGKSSILTALEKGVYNHVPGDGREFVSVSPRAVKIRAEDGRSVNNVNISPFISNLPYGKDTTTFKTADASGSTSQAASIIEAMEAGVDTCLVDEDTCATNFMIRDARMAELVAKDKEPITPFIAKVRAMYETKSISSILVIGGCGDYFEVADTVVMMDSYLPYDVTERAKAIAAQHRNENGQASSIQQSDFGQLTSRCLLPRGLTPQGESQKIAARRLDTIQFGDSNLDLGGVEQLVELGQVKAIADIMQWLVQKNALSGSRTMSQILDLLEQEMHDNSLDAIAAFSASGDLVLPRRFEIAAALNRLRTATFESSA